MTVVTTSAYSQEVKFEYCPKVSCECECVKLTFDRGLVERKGTTENMNDVKKFLVAQYSGSHSGTSKFLYGVSDAFAEYCYNKPVQDNVVTKPIDSQGLKF